ncbi:MAG: hypothetical protein LBC10_05240 [Deltaproteobacteria bacterium]|jgi:hypothetical protein|nr:hypothetical protein [Deltaproteobacteria bacterium]
MPRIGVKFCGNCQPRRDMVALYDLLKMQAPDLDFIGWAEPNYAALLVLQACDAVCATPPPFAGPKVEVVASTLDFTGYEDTDDLVQAALAALRRAARSAG